MNDIDAVLFDAGERWRAAQAAPAPLDPAVFRREARGRGAGAMFALAGMGAAVVLVVAVVAAQLGGSSGVGGGPAAGTSAGVSEPAPGSPAAVGSTSPAPGASGDAVACDVTRPDEPFTPPSGYLATPPGAPAEAWYGTPVLWTLLDRDGEVWAHLPASPEGVSQKTFWWSTDWVPEDDPQPDITVAGTRLDAPGSFSAGPGTNASGDFGTAMLVGVTVPSAGCWRLTASYLDASLSVVVLVED